MKYVVTLVHGTFAKRAAWVQNHSLLCSSLETLLHTPVQFQRVKWSGRNTATARERGAAHLVNELREQFKKATPGDKHFVLAHSHGGNVAMYAMRDETIRENTSGIITLATPFTIVTRRLSIYWDALILGSGWALYALLFSNLIYDTFLLSNVNPWLGRSLQALVFLTICVLGSRLWNRLEDHSESLTERLTLPKVDPEKLLILRVAGDEASLGLLFGQFLALIPYRLFLRGLAVCQLFTSLNRKWRLVGQLGVLICSILIGVFIGPILLSLWLFQIAFSMDPRGINPFLDITSEPTPTGNWNVHMLRRDRVDIPHAQTVLVRAETLRRDLPDPGKDVFSPSALLHSHLYSDWHALEIIAKWMVSRGASFTAPRLPDESRKPLIKSS